MCTSDAVLDIFYKYSFRQCIKFASILSLSKENVHLELPVEFLVFMYTACCAPAFEHTLYTFRFGETTFSHLSPGFYNNMCILCLPH